MIELESEFFHVINALTNSYIDEWKKANAGVVGFYCSTIPEELFYAAGLLPFRMRANNARETTLADALLSRFNCSYIRCSLNQALKGDFRFLDGFVVSSSCDHVRRMYDMWIRKVDKPAGFPIYFLSVPRVVTDEGFQFLLEEYNMLKTAIEENFRVKISDEKLLQAIKIYNENREILRFIQALRACEKPRILASEFLKILLVNASLPRHVGNAFLRDLLNTVNSRPGLEGHTRLMIVGSYVDKPEFLQIFEEVGGIVVTDSLCTSVRYFVDSIQDGSNPLEAIARHYYTKLSCPRMMDQHQQRLRFIKDQVKAARVEGVVLQRIEFCDLHGCDNMLLQEEIEEDLGLPVLNIDREYLLGDIGRFKTRIEAFIEQIKVR